MGSFIHAASLQRARQGGLIQQTMDTEKGIAKGETVTLATDGASRGNPGAASIGFAICREDGTVLVERGEPIGRATNNEAEYRALIAGLERLADLTRGPVRHLSDSQLMVRQLAGRYRVKAANLRPLFSEVQEKREPFETVTHTHVPREHELIQRVDAAANRALDGGD